MTPTEIEKYINSNEELLVRKIMSFKYSFIYILIILSGILYFSLPLWTQFEYPKWSKFFIAQDRTWALIILIVGSFLVYLTNQKLKAFISFLIVSCSWLIPIYILGSFRWQSFAPIFFILINFGFLKLFKKKQLFSLIFVFITFIGLVVFLGYDVNQNNDGKIFQYFSILHIEVVLFFFINLIYSKNLINLSCFNPLQLFSPLPIPDETTIVIDDTDKKFYFFKGILYIIQSQIIFVSMMLLFKSNTFKEPPSIPIQFYFFILFITASLKVCSGLLWMYGYKAPSTSYFFALAKSPLEAWQRGSVFFAKFIFSKIYLPIWIKFRSNLFAIIGSVLFISLHLFLLHEFVLSHLLAYLFPKLNFIASTWLSLKQQSYWILLWLLWIIAFELTFKKNNFFTKTKTGNWLLVIFTHVGNMSIIPIAMLLSNIL